MHLRVWRNSMGRETNHYYTVGSSRNRYYLYYLLRVFLRSHRLRRNDVTLLSVPLTRSTHVHLKIAMSSLRWSALAMILASAPALWGQSQFWGELKAGKYAVGFRSLYQLDVARSYDADY